MPKHKPDPVKLYAESQALHAAWIAKEAEAIRAALDASDWLVKPAARLLGYPRHTSLVRLLETRHSAIGEELAQRRIERGFTSGNPAPMRTK